MQVQDVTVRTVLQVKKFSILQTSNIVLVPPPTALRFFMLDAVGIASRLHVADRTRIIMYSSDFIMQIIKQHAYHFVIGSKKAIKSFRPSTIFVAQQF